MLPIVAGTGREAGAIGIMVDITGGIAMIGAAVAVAIMVATGTAIRGG
jgi:hypothetical protein